MIQIPDRIKGFNFVLINPAGDGKNPLEKAWQKTEHRYDDKVLLQHLARDFNYGVRGGRTSSIAIDGKSYFLVVVDFDKRQFQEVIMPKLPETFTTTSGSSKQCYHLWFASDDDESFKIMGENRETLCDVIGGGKQLIGPNSKHKSGSIYSIVKDLPFAFIPYAELKALLMPYDKKPKKPVKEKPVAVPMNMKNDFADKLLSSVSMSSVLSALGVDTSKNPTNCPLHSSNHGRCLSWNDETAHCFHCQSDHEGWNKFSLVREARKLNSKETFEWFADKAGMTEELKQSRTKYANQNNPNKTAGVFDFEGIIDSFLDKNPIFFDRSKTLWKWDKEKYLWERIDDVDLRITLSQAHKENRMIGRRLVELVLERARLRIPENPKPTWIQFYDRIYDFTTGGYFKATPKYFVTNPIPYKVGVTDSTPNIDKLFTEWVGEKYVPTLYEMLAYSSTPNKFMQRLFALVGGGSNGKSTFIALIQRFLGKSNYTSSELKLLAERNFETAILYKKLLCVIGEVSYDDLTNTSQIKKLSGEDDIRFEFKGKQPFSDKNAASIMCLTNSLPRTPDRSLGFYRRWLIVDFPNQFPVGKNPIDSIPESEFENLAYKVLKVLSELYKNRSFTNEGSYEEREKAYEEKSNPIVLFLEEFCEDTPGQHIPKKVFYDEFNKWLKERHQRPLSAQQITRMLSANGYDVGSRKIGGGSCQVVVNVSFRGGITISTIVTAKNQIDSTYVKTNLKTHSNLGTSGNSKGPSKEFSYSESEGIYL